MKSERSYMVTSQKRLNKLFRDHDGHGLDFKKRNGDFCTDTRLAFIDFVDYMQKSGLISEKLAERATLK